MPRGRPKKHKKPDEEANAFQVMADALTRMANALEEFVASEVKHDEAEAEPEPADAQTG